MFDPQDRSWIEYSVDAPRAKTEVSFLIPTQFHKDPNNLDEEPLKLPNVGNLRGDTNFISASDALAETQPLIEYYKEVLALAAEYSQPYDEICSFFGYVLASSQRLAELVFPGMTILRKLTACSIG